MKLAPIILGTYNRIDHLKRCIDSLRLNSLACESEIFISCNYPEKKSDFKGYHEVKKFLMNLNSGFKKINIYYQTEPVGWKGNFEFLRNWVFKEYDRIISIEDDVEVSPNFLEYINKGLDLFENDENIVAICGYSADLPWIYKNDNVIKMQTSFAEWGYGTWKNKYKKMEKWINRRNLTRLINNKEFCDKLYNTNYELYGCLIDAVLQDPIRNARSPYIGLDGDIMVIDYTVRLYLLARNKYAISPVITKSRNIGYDDSGVNCNSNINDTHANRKIDENAYFKYIINADFGYDERNAAIYNQNKYLRDATKAKIKRKIIQKCGINRLTRLLCRFYDYYERIYYHIRCKQLVN